jgi:hypothetical protein
VKTLYLLLLFGRKETWRKPGGRVGGGVDSRIEG